MAVNDTFNDSEILRSKSNTFGRKKILKKRTSILEDQLITCPKCRGVMVDAVVFGGRTTCLECCENKSEAIPSEILRRNIGDMAGRCPFSDQGCEWTGELKNISEHLKECEFFEKKCPFADFGCTFKTPTEFKMKTHKRIFKMEHYEMKLDHLEKENALLKLTNESMKRRVEVLLDINHISKFVETRKKCLEGVEWRVTPTHTTGQLEGPSFYIRGYHLQLVGKVGDNLKFHVRRIPGEFDDNLPAARLAFTSAEQVGREKTSNSPHEHKLEPHSLSEEIDHGRLNPCTMRFYFDIEEMY